MAKKKSSQQKTPATKEFSSSPFKDLKGLSAFREPPASSKNPDKQKNSGLEKAVAPASDATSFADEMDFLGVKPLPGITIQGSAPARDQGMQTPALPVSAREELEQQVFLEALGTMEKTFVDEWSDEGPAIKALPRRIKQVERGQLKPEAELDLHGLTVEEACAKVGFFLQDAFYQGLQTTLIITGKGLHSAAGPVLRQAVERLLESQSELVLEWGLAPQRYGGSGALVVFLRRVEKPGL